MPPSDLGRILVAIGVVILITGLILILWPRLPLLGRLPGDLSFHRNGLQVFIPIGTSIALSIILTLIINVIIRIFR